MNGLQSGSPASQLAPQAYKNSSQTPGIQSTIDSTNIQSGNINRTINTLPVQGKLVVVGQNSSTLGLSTQVSAQPQSTNFIPATLVLIAVSLGLAVYFFRRYKSIVVLEDEQ